MLMLMTKMCGASLLCSLELIKAGWHSPNPQKGSQINLPSFHFQYYGVWKISFADDHIHAYKTPPTEAPVRTTSSVTDLAGEESVIAMEASRWVVCCTTPDEWGIPY